MRRIVCSLVISLFVACALVTGAGAQGLSWSVSVTPTTVQPGGDLTITGQYYYNVPVPPHVTTLPSVQVAVGVVVDGFELGEYEPITVTDHAAPVHFTYDLQVPYDFPGTSTPFPKGTYTLTLYAVVDGSWVDPQSFTITVN